MHHVLCSSVFGKELQQNNLYNFISNFMSFSSDFLIKKIRRRDDYASTFLLKRSNEANINLERTSTTYPVTVPKLKNLHHIKIFFVYSKNIHEVG